MCQPSIHLYKMISIDPKNSCTPCELEFLCIFLDRLLPKNKRYIAYNQQDVHVMGLTCRCVCMVGLLGTYALDRARIYHFSVVCVIRSAVYLYHQRLSQKS